MEYGQYSPSPGSGLEGVEMSCGKMNSFIDIIECITLKDTEGFRTQGDQVIASVRAYREGRHGNEKWANRAIFSEATDLFRFRKIPDVTVTTQMLISCSSGRFEITSVENVKDRGMYIEVLAKEVTPSG